MNNQHVLTPTDELGALAKEAEVLLRALPRAPGMQDDARAIQAAAALHRQGGDVDFEAVDRCIRRLRMAALMGKYPDPWPQDWN